jgi:hypothetical protein
MTETRPEGKIMKQIRLGVICCFALALSVFGGASSAGAEGEFSILEACEANKICIYSSTTYNNWTGKIECSFSGATPPLAAQSATNRCGNKTAWLRVNGTAIACMNPGGNRPHPGLFNEVYVAKEYGAFC